MPGQGPPLFFPDYWPQHNPFMDDHFQPHMNNMQFMGQPFGGNRFQQMRGPIWGQNFQQNRNHYWHNHNYRGNNHSGCHRATRHANTEPEKICFICQDALQNSAERGIHLCDGGATVQKESTKDDSTPENYNVDLSDMDARLETLLNELKDCLRNKYESVTETLEKYVSSRVDEISTIHKDVLEDKTHLEKLRLQLESKSTELQQKEKSLRDKESQLKKDRQKYDKEIHEEKEEICRQWQELRDEIARMEKLHEVQKGRIKLDIGGVNFTTSKLTLTRDSESMLAAMFSGRHEVRVEDDGTIFIDRDGTHFRYILNYLRDGGIKLDALPRNRQVLRELRNEAIFYQLHGLVQQIEKLI